MAPALICKFRMRFLSLAACCVVASLAAVLPAWATPPDISLTQVMQEGGQPLPRPTTGVAAPGQEALPFHLQVAYRCPAGTVAAQLLLSAADTTRIEALARSPLTVRLDVPVPQLEWLMTPGRSCNTLGRQRQPDETGSGGIRYYRLRAAATAYGTLLCRAGDGSDGGSTTSIPLDVWLSCPAAGSR